MKKVWLADMTWKEAEEAFKNSKETADRIYDEAVAQAVKVRCDNLEKAWKVRDESIEKAWQTYSQKYK